MAIVHRHVETPKLFSRLRFSLDEPRESPSGNFRVLPSSKELLDLLCHSHATKRRRGSDGSALPRQRMQCRRQLFITLLTQLHPTHRHMLRKQGLCPIPFWGEAGQGQSFGGTYSVMLSRRRDCCVREGVLMLCVGLRPNSACLESSLTVMTWRDGDEGRHQDYRQRRVRVRVHFPNSSRLSPDSQSLASPRSRDSNTSFPRTIHFKSKQLEGFV